MSTTLTTPTSDSLAQFSFADMHLQPGDRLQLHCPTHPDRARHISRAIGFVEGLSLLVTLPSPHGVRAPFMEHEIVVVQTFSRNNAFAFKSTIQKIQRLPFDYMHLTIPTQVQGSMVRNAVRVRVQINATATPPGGEPVSARIENISATGALIAVDQALPESSTIGLNFSVNLHDVTSEVSLTAAVLNVRHFEGCARHGLEFSEIGAQDRMILRSLIYQQMIEKPRSVA